MGQLYGPGRTGHEGATAVGAFVTAAAPLFLMAGAGRAEEVWPI